MKKYDDGDFTVTEYDSGHIVRELRSFIVPDSNAPALKKAISQIEQFRQPRAIREWILTGEKTALQQIENDIAILRNQIGE